MVQLTNHSPPGQSRVHAGSLDPYWKLDNGNQYDKKTLLGILKDKNISCASNASRARVQELYVRCQRGFLSYEGMKAPELRTYITQRNSSVTACMSQNITAPALKTLLEQADEDSTFDRFLNLPAELRLRVYSHYFKSFIGTPAIIIAQPPITGASQSIREESLPVFYGCCDFSINTIDIPSSLGSFYSAQTDRLLEIATTDHFGWIQHVTMRLKFQGCEIELTIDMNNNKRTPVKVFHLLKPSVSGPTHLSEAQSDCISLELGILVEGIVAREEVPKLKESDLKCMHEIVRSFLV